MTDANQQLDFGDVKQRLEQIADEVSDDGLSLDRALDLFEEAVSLSMQAGGLLEVGVDEAVDPEELDDTDEAPATAEGGNGAIAG